MVSIFFRISVSVNLLPVSGVMESVYSEGLDGKKSRHPWNQLTSSMCILRAYCNLRLPKKVILATLGFQTPINCPTVFFAEPCHQGNEPVYWGDS